MDDLRFSPIPIHAKRTATEPLVRDLNFDLKRPQKEHGDGSRGTRTARSYVLAQIADTLHDLGFRDLWATGLRRKHVVALVRELKRQRRSIGTMNPSCPVQKTFLIACNPHPHGAPRRPELERTIADAVAEAPALRVRSPEDPQHQDPAPGVEGGGDGGRPRRPGRAPQPRRDRRAQAGRGRELSIAPARLDRGGAA